MWSVSEPGTQQHSMPQGLFEGQAVVVPGSLWTLTGTRPVILASRWTSAALSSASLITAATARVTTILAPVALLIRREDVLDRTLVEPKVPEHAR
jgi:hypothetical protein